MNSWHTMDVTISIVTCCITASCWLLANLKASIISEALSASQLHSSKARAQTAGLKSGCKRLIAINAASSLALCSLSKCRCICTPSLLADPIVENYETVLWAVLIWIAFRLWKNSSFTSYWRNDILTICKHCKCRILLWQHKQAHEVSKIHQKKIDASSSSYSSQIQRKEQNRTEWM